MKRFASTICILVLLLFSVFTLVTCTKEHSFERGLPSTTAIYSVDGICTNAIINGKYYVSEAVDTSHNIQLQINVIKTGSFYISTNTTDGIQFSATGNFTTTGLQTVILKASGTPSLSGSFIFAITNNTACSIALLVNAKRVKMAAFNLVGQPNTCATAILSGNYVAGVAMKTLNTVDIQVNIAGIGAFTITTDTLDGIYFSASGSFSNVGNQIVTLAANGTPDAARNLVFTPKADTDFCSFPLTILPPEPTAVYVLESGFGTASPCIYTVNGNYVTNTALNNFNTVVMSVYVASVGNCAIATNTVNGMTFTFSGVFTSSGTQKVTLVGNGTPLNKGSFALSPQIIGPHPLGGQVCGIVINVN
jgi:hypothetical protein